MARKRLTLLCTGLLTLAVMSGAANATATQTVPSQAARPQATGCTTRTHSDFNGDRHSDALAADLGVRDGHGGIRVIYGGTFGLTTDGNQYIDATSLASKGIAFIDSPGQSGFFNTDCYADVSFAISVDGGQEPALFVAYGSASGLDVANGVIFTEAQVTGDRKQTMVPLAAGDFNGDGTDDLAISFPSREAQEDGNGTPGGVAVLYGSSTGLTLTGKQWFDQSTAGIPGSNDPIHHFGAALAATDFSRDGKADLAIGMPAGSGYGSVLILKGSGSGLTTSGLQQWAEGTPGVAGAEQKSDSFGGTLATGDITGDGRPDLVIGAPDATTGTGNANLKLSTGAITVLIDGSTGLSATHSQHFTQDSSGVPGVSEAGDAFGSSLALGDFNGDGHADAAIGAPTEDIGTVQNAGDVVVLYGRSTGLTSAASQAWSQNKAGVIGTSEHDDVFGSSLQALQTVTPSHYDLIIGVPGEDSSFVTDCGAVAVLRGGGANGITATGDQFLDGSSLLFGAGAGVRLN